MRLFLLCLLYANQAWTDAFRETSDLSDVVGGSTAAFTRKGGDVRRDIAKIQFDGFEFDRIREPPRGSDSRIRTSQVEIELRIHYFVLCALCKCQSVKHL